MYNVKQYLKLRGKISGDIMPIIVNEMEVQDIDNEEDWKLAELKYNIMNSMNK
jgi:pseudaminic acid cytidylyltransferase